MAEKTLAAIAEEASHRFGTDRITVLHRVGELRVGEVSTAIAVATPHRGEAYEASRYIIEEIKRATPHLEAGALPGGGFRLGWWRRRSGQRGSEAGRVRGGGNGG